MNLSIEYIIDYRSSISISDSVECIALSQSTCSMSHILQYMLAKADESICSNGPACITEYGVFNSVPGRYCMTAILSSLITQRRFRGNN